MLFPPHFQIIWKQVCNSQLLFIADVGMMILSTCSTEYQKVAKVLHIAHVN